MRGRKMIGALGLLAFAALVMFTMRTETPSVMPSVQNHVSSVAPKPSPVMLPSGPSTAPSRLVVEFEPQLVQVDVTRRNRRH